MKSPTFPIAENNPPKPSRGLLHRRTTGDVSAQHEKHQQQQQHPAHMKLAGEDAHSSLFVQVYEWLQRERTRRKAHTKKATVPSDGADDDDKGDDHPPPLERTSSQTSEGTASLDRLENILHQYAEKRHEGFPLIPIRRGTGTRRRTIVKGLRGEPLSESDNAEFETTAPYVDAFLDNTRTLGYSGGGPDDGDDEKSESTKRAKEKENWLVFKNDMLRIIHTMRLKGWRRVPVEAVGEIDVARLSGALTNAVYVVTPPQIPYESSSQANGSQTVVPKKPPP